MDTYLFDTNLVSVLYDSGRPNHLAVRAAVAGFDPAAPQLVSSVTIGELRFDLALSRAAGRPLASFCRETTSFVLGRVNSPIKLGRTDV
jgi:predicted nucleic acid-binding protein